MESLNHGDYADKLTTKFKVVERDQLFDLELIGANETKFSNDGESFSLIFRGDKSELLPQDSYSLEHESLAGGKIFLVPIGENDDGYLYQAVFNRIKSVGDNTAAVCSANENTDAESSADQTTVEDKSTDN